MNRVFLKNSEAGANMGGAMETGDHYKNGYSSKSVMSRGNIIRKVCFALLTASVIIFASCSCGGNNKSSKSERWEYKVMCINSIHCVDDIARIENTLNSLGADGWELISVARETYSSPFLTFKRKLP